MSDDDIFHAMVGDRERWKNTDNGLGALFIVAMLLLCICSPAIVWVVYTWAF